MKALIVYTSWRRPSRTVANMIALKLAGRDFVVRCTSARRVAPHDLNEYDLLVLGTDGHMGHASKRLRSLCAAIPQHRFDRLEIALFGVRPARKQPRYQFSALDELEACIANRGCELALPPLVVAFQPAKALLPGLGINNAERAKVEAFVAELWEAIVPEPMI